MNTNADHDGTAPRANHFSHAEEERAGTRPLGFWHDIAQGHLLWTPWLLILGISLGLWQPLGVWHWSTGLSPKMLNLLGLLALILLGLGLLTWGFRQNEVRQSSKPRVPLWLKTMVLALLLVFLGYATLWLRVDKLAPLPQEVPFRVQQIEAQVLERNLKAERVQLLVFVKQGILFPNKRLYHRFRLSAPKAFRFAHGQTYQIRVRLKAIEKPAYVGGYNPRWISFFEAVAAHGFVLSQPRLLDRADGGYGYGGSAVSLRAIFDRLRDRIARRLEAQMDAQTVGIAQALLIGQRSQVLIEQTRALRDAGLSHLLAISGLHVALVFGLCFLLLNKLIPLWLLLFARRYPYWDQAFWLLGYARDLSLGLALLCALFYMLLAGSPLPTIRAVCMTGLFVLALLARRQPFSLHAIALAACLILLFWPESVLSASFVLSFAVVLSLVALANALQRRRFAKAAQDMLARERSWISRLARKVGFYLLGLVLTSLTASLVSTPISLYFFQNHSIVGILANLIAVPLTAFIIMPSALMAVALMPIGLEAVPLWLMEWGILGLLDVAFLAASWDLLNLKTSAQLLGFPHWGKFAINPPDKMGWFYGFIFR